MGFRIITLRKFFTALSVIVLTVQLCYGGSRSDEEKLVTSINNFAFNFYRQLTVQNKESFICSPYSASVALSMLLVGARTKTAAEIIKTLKYRANDLSVQQVQKVYHKLLSDQNRPKKGFDLSVANSFWVKLGAQLLPKYRSAIEKNFFAKGKEVNFVKPSTTNEINKWVNKATKGKIPKMLHELDPETFLILINAVYFKGEWDHSFNKSLTSVEKFHNAFSNSIKKVLMMKATGIYKHVHITSLKADILRLPYQRKEYCMLILLPKDKKGLRKLEKKVTAKIVNDGIKASDQRIVRLNFPRIKLSSTLILNKVLKSLGTKLAFTKSAEFSESAESTESRESTENADFSGINGKRNLFVSKVIQKAICEINEKGTIAAAVTAIVEPRPSTPPRPLQFSVDHPFLFLIRHEKTGLILFMGRVFEL